MKIRDESVVEDVQLISLNAEILIIKIKKLYFVHTLRYPHCKRVIYPANLQEKDL